MHHTSEAQRKCGSGLANPSWIILCRVGSEGFNMGYYPVFLEMNRRRCVVIGGGWVAERKVEGLLAAGAAVTVVSPAITARLKDWLAQDAIRHVGREYEAGDLAENELVFSASDHPAVNAAVCRDARSLGIWVNAADDPEHCGFILPAVLRRGELVVAVSTGGASPAVTRAVREELEEYFSSDYAQLVQIASEVRRELREKSLSVSAEAWNKALKGNFRRFIEEGKAEQAKELLLSVLGAGS
jgi:precorrin-2 dehydrogenase/sirohydrochlorin ferrochelatase